MDESEMLFHLFYLLICMVIIYPPEELSLMGLTIEKLFDQFLGNENHHFVHYHQKRTSLNLFVHSCLPFLHFLMFRLLFDDDAHEITTGFDIRSFYRRKIGPTFFLMGILTASALIFNWSQRNWKRHPISQSLLKFSNEPQSYDALASDIGTEFRRPDAYRKKLNAISNVIITDNWIIKTSLYNVHFAHQSDTTLSVAKAETYNVTVEANETLQMISICVQANRNGVADFNIRINAVEFRNLEESLRRPITIPSNIQFHRHVIDRFIEVFKKQISENPTYKADRVADKCFACMLVEPNIKIHKQCEDVDAEGRPMPNDQCCSNCYCRPMWCVECLARWFVAKQNDYDRDVWLEQKCTCPMCRAKFCLLDVSYIVREDNERRPD